MSRITAFLQGTTDISSYLTQDINLDEALPDFGQVIISNISSITAIDNNNFWNTLSPSSVFYNYQDLTVFYIDIYFEDNLIASPLIKSIDRQSNGTAIINLVTPIQKALDQRFIYVSSENLNPALIFKELMTLYNIPYDNGSASISSTYYELNSVVCSAYITEPKMTILSFLESLVNIGVARIYEIQNKLFFEVYRDVTLTPLITINSIVTNSSNLEFDRPVITLVVKQPINGYTVNYVGGTLEFISPETTMIGQQLQSISGGSDSEVRINNLQSATWIGETWLGYLNLIQTQIEVNADSRYVADLQIGYPVAVYDPISEITTSVELNSVSRNLRVRSPIKGISR